ncbi:MAG TPA: hypothetical protein ENJ45_03985 [Phaeodactylibacter sp.]|nr:hypothetical protein [Phaeodactylibacter sp.]
MSRFFTIFLFVLTSIALYAQSKSLPATRLVESIKIDGVLDEAAWQSAPIATGFVEHSPNPGATSEQNTQVRLLYDDRAIYVAAYLKDSQPDSILHQLTERDKVGITDWFAIVIDAYQDGQNGVGFVVTPLGIQIDQKYSAFEGRRGGGRGGPIFSGDTNWDAVWNSATKIVADGWVVEMSIPFSAIRFPNKEVQDWNINFARMIRRHRQTAFWNTVNPEIAGLLNQSGTLSGIQDIKSPVRLSATPFLVNYLEVYHDKNSSPVNSTGYAINGGMDVKYGINDAFTLDMTLIPDFGQTRSDNQVLNLSPFEIQFDENRAFFTEGTELFNKGDVFYSRRVGGRPLYFYDVYDALRDEETLLNNPQDTRLYNATKLSGRTNGGLGIGLFNATSQATYAEVENTNTKERRKILTNPLTNYNVIVLDQNLKNNSSATFINTNVWRSGHAYDANVTGALFNLRDKENEYQLRGYNFLSQKYYGGKDAFSGDSIGLGYAYRLGFGKSSGQFQYEVSYNVLSRHYDSNDLGFLRQPNLRSTETEISYNIYKPFGNFNRMRIRTGMEYVRLQSPNVFSEFWVETNFFAVTKKFFAFGGWIEMAPIGSNDYYEPRSEDYSRYYKVPVNGSINTWLSSDYRKTFAFDLRAGLGFFDQDKRFRYNINLSPRYRVNDHLSFVWDISYSLSSNDVGYVTNQKENIIFGIRDIKTWENVLDTRYIFNHKMSLIFRLRHYLSAAQYHSFLYLKNDGSLSSSTYEGFHNSSFNAFNIDMEYRWRFAPGSDVFFVWKNAIFEGTDLPSHIQYNYQDGLSRLLNIPQRNSFSVKVIYYLDYLDFVKRG